MDNLLTIIIPTYNRSNGLKELLASIYNHNLDKKMNLEVIVSDDSTNEKEIKYIMLCVSYYRDICYHNITYIRNKYNRVGPAANRQNGLDNATGKWVLFVDDDDILYQFDDELIQKLYQDDISYIITHYDTFDYDRNIPVVFTNDNSVQKCLTHGKIYNRQFIKDNGIHYDITAPAHEDIYFNYWCYSATLNNPEYHVEYLLDKKYIFYHFKYYSKSLSKSDNFFHNYISEQPLWFLNQFDAPLGYAISNRNITQDIFDFIKNEVCYSIIMYLKSIEWSCNTEENMDLYKKYFDTLKTAFRGKINEEGLSKISIEVLYENGLVNEINQILQYFTIIQKLFLEV